MLSYLLSRKLNSFLEEVEFMGKHRGTLSGLLADRWTERTMNFLIELWKIL